MKKPHFNKNKLITSLFISTAFASHADEFQVTELFDNGSGLTSGTLSWAILQANTNPGLDAITLTNDVTFTGVMKRIIDSDIRISSDETRRIIDGGNLTRPLFIKSGNVLINNIDMTNGRAKGGNGNSGGAGLGGSIFIYDGTITINNLNIRNSVCIGAEGSRFPFGGGGMQGDASGDTGGGLFSGSYGGYNNYNSPLNFGHGSSELNVNGGFGGGGYGTSSDYYLIMVATNGGFGAGGGTSSEYDDKYVRIGDGGFGGGGGYEDYNGNHGLPGFGGNVNNGAGLGGALFIRTGSINISDVTFSDNSATAFDGAKGLGGAIFILHSTQNSNGNNQGMPHTLPEVTACEVSFSNNSALSDPNLPLNNDDVFDEANRINRFTGNALDVPCDDDFIFQHGFEPLLLNNYDKTK